MQAFRLVERPAILKRREIRQIRRLAVDQDGNRRPLTQAERAQIATLRTEIATIVIDVETVHVPAIVAEEDILKALIHDTGTIIPEQQIPEGPRIDQFRRFTRNHAMSIFRFNGSLYTLMRTRTQRLADRLRTIPGLVLEKPTCDDQGVCTGGDEYLTVQARGWWS